MEDDINNPYMSTNDQIDWRQLAACADEDPEIFFPSGDRGMSATQAKAAKAVCASCGVRQTCLEDDLSHGKGKIWGVYGGLTERERRRLLKGPAEEPASESE